MELPGEHDDPAGERLLVFAKEQDATTGLHSGFGLDDDGEGVYLFDTAANGGGLIDSVEFGFQVTGLAIARTGADQDWTLASPTPGSPNAAPFPTGAPGSLVINEWLSTSGIVYDNDFLELYNPTALPVSLAGLTLTDDPNNDPTQHTVALLSFIDAFGFVKFIADNDPEQGASHLSFNLSKLLERVGLYDTDGEVIDRIEFANSIDDTSGGRVVDGSLLFTNFAIPTPGFSNGTDLSAETLVLQSLRVTELMYNPIGGGNFEYVKLQNVGTESISLANVQFDEGISFRFPDVALAAGEIGYLASNTASFQATFGAGLNLIGEYGGQLSNGGERLRLEIASLGAGILDFDYNDNWYPITDGGGASLVIINPSAAPASWSESTSWQPSISDEQSYDDWALANGVGNKNEDPDGDGIGNLLEFVFDRDPNSTDLAGSLPEVSLTGDRLTLDYTTVQLPFNISIIPQVSADGETWASDILVSVQLISETATTRTYRATDNRPGTPERRLMRLYVECDE